MCEWGESGTVLGHPVDGLGQSHLVVAATRAEGNHARGTVALDVAGSHGGPALRNADSDWG